MRDFSEPVRHRKIIKSLLRNTQAEFPIEQRRCIAQEIASRTPLPKDHPHVFEVLSAPGCGQRLHFSLLTDEDYKQHPEIDGIFNVLVRRQGEGPDLEAVFAPRLLNENRIE